MDSALAPLVAQESARPASVYRTFLPAESASAATPSTAAPNKPVWPSPLLAELPHVLAHFQFEPDGRISSPRVPPPSRHRLAVPRFVSQRDVEKTQACLKRLAAKTDRDRLIAILPDRSSAPAEAVFQPPSEPSAQQLTQKRRRADLQTHGRGQVEYDERSRALEMNKLQYANTALSQQAQVVAPQQVQPIPLSDVAGVLMTSLWLGDDLVLARRIKIGGQEYVQGCLLDWQSIRNWLLGSVDDLLPAAALRPQSAPPGELGSHMLAALPVQLIPGRLPTDVASPVWPIRLSLLVAWGGTLLAAAAVAALLGGILRLSTRRAAFVSAVTHELRTPLTTFRMYTEMLAEGMVPAAQQLEYLHTLQRETARLTHMVENVLAYARLERGRGNGPLETMAVESLVEPIRSRLADRAFQSGMDLVVEPLGNAPVLVVRANPSVVEQILFNLVDNACKYAAAAADKRIHLVIQTQGAMVQLCVRDHGPGIPRAVRNDCSIPSPNLHARQPIRRRAWDLDWR